MTTQQFNQLYEEVKSLSQYGETTTGTDETTSLYDWMKEGDCESTPAAQIAAEWDELCADEEEATTE